MIHGDIYEHECQNTLHSISQIIKLTQIKEFKFTEEILPSFLSTN